MADRPNAGGREGGEDRETRLKPGYPITRAPESDTSACACMTREPSSTPRTLHRCVCLRMCECMHASPGLWRLTPTGTIFTRIGLPPHAGLSLSVTVTTSSAIDEQANVEALQSQNLDPVVANVQVLARATHGTYIPIECELCLELCWGGWKGCGKHGVRGIAIPAGLSTPLASVTPSIGTSLVRNQISNRRCRHYVCRSRGRD